MPCHLLLLGSIVQVSKIFDDAQLSCLCLCGAHMFWLKSCVPDAMAFMTHNYVFPRGIGIVDWCLLPEMKQVLVFDHLHDDIRWSPAFLLQVSEQCKCTACCSSSRCKQCPGHGSCQQLSFHRVWPSQKVHRCPGCRCSVHICPQQSA